MTGKGRATEWGPLRPVVAAPDKQQEVDAALASGFVMLIRESQFTEEARLDAYLDGVVSAAEQVQDKRIEMLENPEPPGWDKVLFTFMLTVALESTLAGAVLAAATKFIFTRTLKLHRVFLRLPKSPSGRDLKRRVQDMARADALRQRGIPRGAALTADREKSREAIATVLREGVGAGGLADLGRENVELYHRSLEALVRGTDATATNLAALAKGAREMVENPAPGSARNLAATDSAGVTVLTAAQHYASTTRMAMRVRHARFESLVLGGELTRNDLMLVADLFDPPPLTESGQAEVAVDLKELRDRYRLLFEAVIWTVLYGVDRSRGTPKYTTKGLDGVPDRLSDYWIARFGDAVDEWTKTLNPSFGYRGRFQDQKRETQLLNLRDWMLAIADKAPLPPPAAGRRK